MPFALGVLVDVFFGKTGEEDTVEARVESVEVGAAHVADTWLGLKERWDKVKGINRETQQKMVTTAALSDTHQLGPFMLT